MKYCKFEHGNLEHGNLEHGNLEHGNLEHVNLEHGNLEHEIYIYIIKLYTYTLVHLCNCPALLPIESLRCGGCCRFIWYLNHLLYLGSTTSLHSSKI
jgi:hypothetical protein